MSGNFVVISSAHSSDAVVLTASCNGKPVKTYHFESRESGTELGAQIITGALAGWAATDLCLAGQVVVDVDLPRAGHEFIQGLYKTVTDFYRKLFNRDFAELSFRKPVELTAHKISLDSHTTFLGKSGGKDSTLVEIVLQREGKQRAVPYKISYEESKEGDFVIYEREITPAICNNTVPLRAFPQRGEFAILEPTDIGLTFLAPYFNVRNGFPSTTAIGLQWDSRWIFPEIASSLVPTESPTALKLYAEFMQNMGLEWLPILPIYSIHTNGVYRALENLLGAERVDRMVSCWEFSDWNCGNCPKCQRVKYVTKIALGRTVLPAIPLVDVDPILIYGSINAAGALTKYPKLPWERIVVYHTDGFERDAHRNILGEILGAVEVPASSLNFKFALPSIPKGHTTDKIAHAIGAHYGELADEPCNAISVPLLPFEKHYEWGRNNKLLNCYGIWPFVEDGKLTYVQISKGPKLVLPMTPVFEHFFDSKFNGAFK